VGDYCSAGFLQQRTHGLSDWTGALPERAGDPGAGPGMETDEEVALIPADSEAGSVRRTRKIGRDRCVVN
jgi:hypothetical protein